MQSKTLFKPEKTTLSESDFKEELISVKEELLNEENYENLHMLEANRVVDEPVKPTSEQVQKAIEKRFGQTGLSLENLEVSVDAQSKVITVTRKRK